MLVSWVVPLMFAGEAVLPAGVEVAVCGDGAEFEHSFDAGQAPEGAADVEAVGDEVPDCSLDDSGGDGPAGRECLVVVEEVAVAAQVRSLSLRCSCLRCGESTGPQPTPSPGRG